MRELLLIISIALFIPGGVFFVVLYYSRRKKNSGSKKNPGKFPDTVPEEAKKVYAREMIYQNNRKSLKVINGGKDE